MFVQHNCISNIYALIIDTHGSTSTSVSGKSEKFPFEFDHVFTDQANQESVFEEVSQLVQSSIDGYNVCIFAYG